MQRSSRAVAVWLFVCVAFVLAMVAVGGLTRLTRSGLSIVAWEPVTGVLPPLSDAAWQAAFDAYRQSPEGRLVNAAMDPDGFREIYLVEWAHRLLARLTGVVVLLPLAWFAATRRLDRRRLAWMLAIFALGGVQGAVGWYMVRSGLAVEPRVSHLRLALHLGFAFAILALLLWNALDAALPRRAAAVPPRARALAAAALALVSLTVIWGAFMAGLHAGHVAPTFPLVNGAWWPDGLWTLAPPAANLVDNALTVHVLHRTLAYVTALVALAAAVAAWRGGAPGLARGAALALVALVGLQIALGALTVLSHVAIAWAALHQLNGALLFAAAVTLVFALRRGAG